MFTVTGTGLSIDPEGVQGNRADVHRTAPAAGMAAENLLLESVALGLGRCSIGGFTSENVINLLGIDKDLRILMIVSIGQQP